MIRNESSPRGFESAAAYELLTDADEAEAGADLADVAPEIV